MRQLSLIRLDKKALSDSLEMRGITDIFPKEQTFVVIDMMKVLNESAHQICTIPRWKYAILNRYCTRCIHEP